jgi:phytoene dehydrogenase-like protein
VDEYDAIVIGAGFGGLGAAVTLAERGARVALLEALTYPGGCASTFVKGGLHYESGATLFAGFDEGQLFAHWIAAHRMEVPLEPVDPVIRFRSPDVSVDVPTHRAALVDQLCALPGAPAGGIRSFFAEQGRVADTLWQSFDDPGRLPPFGPGGLVAHLRDTPALAGLARRVGQPLGAVLASHGVDRFAPLVQLLDGLCQITVQAGVRDAEAPLALAALDFPFRGTRHVRGGVGRLATAMADTVERLGGRVHMACRATRATREGNAWVVTTRKGVVRAPIVIANLLPQAIPELVGSPLPRLDPLARRVAGGWGAAMLYLSLDPSVVTEGPFHLEIVVDPARPLREGNHLFVSVGDDSQPGARTATVSTHVPLDALRGRPPADQATYIAGIQARMREGIRAFAPAIDAGIRHVWPGSPRTFARFTRRAEGVVGGIPRLAGLGHYRDLWPSPVLPGLWLVGDSVFPGQSTLATAIGGRKTAEAALAGR